MSKSLNIIKQCKTLEFVSFSLLLKINISDIRLISLDHVVEKHAKSQIGQMCVNILTI